MKILIVMDPGILVPPKGYGGHERLVEMFALEYARLGHEVHLLVTEGSRVNGCIVHPFGKEGFPPKKWDARVAIPKAWSFLWKNRNDFDLVHNFGRLAYLLPILNHPVKKIMTYGREISQRNILWINRLPIRNLTFTGCSQNLISRIDARGTWKPVYNAIRFDQYTLQPEVNSDAPLIFLGRIERIKGCHTAIEVAKKTNHSLIIAGNISSLPEEKRYFEHEIKPWIDDKQIRFVGEVNDEQKNQLLGSAKALLMPIEWNEPFGIVMIEAMACGTPVIAFPRGSVSEVVEQGKTGCIVDNKQQMIDLLENGFNLNRKNCRDWAEKRFDVKQIAQEYLK
jgi:glycosyltransferase involved in cell wall biosynthesis